MNWINRSRPVIHIDKTLLTVCDAIKNAETTTKDHIKLYYQNVNEEFITTLFYGHIRYKLNEASENESIEKAFLEDLKKAFPYNRRFDLDWELRPKVKGLIADIVLHNKQQEGKTGGDFGLIIIHPQIKVDDDFLEIKKGETSGLLCQAKLKNRSGKWGAFTENQKNVLSQFMDFTSLVLYSYIDENRTELNPISWKICRGKSLPEIDAVLKKDDLENLLGTSDIIKQLGRKEIGTQDETLINNLISLSKQQYSEIRIHWPKKDSPRGSTKIEIQTKQVSKNKAYVYNYHEP